MLSKSIKQSVMGFVNSFCMSFVLFFQLILSSCVSFICWFVMITFIVLLPMRLVCSAVFLSSTRQVHFSATSRHRRHLLDSLSHSIMPGRSSAAYYSSDQSLSQGIHNFCGLQACADLSNSQKGLSAEGRPLQLSSYIQSEL